MKTTKYPIPHNEEGGSLFLLGKPDAPRIVLMCAGFPDDQSAFLSLAERLAQKNCLVGVACLPGYDKRGYKDGYTLQDWVYCMTEAAKALRAQSSPSSAAKFTGIFHDWGCVAGPMFTNHALEKNSDELVVPDEVVLFDVCPPVHPKATTTNLQVKQPSLFTAIYSFAVLVAYQFLLAQCFLLQRYISEHLATLYFGIGWKVISLLKLAPLCAMGDKAHFEKQVKQTSLAHILYMAYPYYYTWKAILCNSSELSGFCMPLDLQQTPILYMYGADKNIHFHDATSLALLHMLLQQEEAEGRQSKAIEVTNAGHWLYVQQEDVCFHEIVKFLGL